MPDCTPLPTDAPTRQGDIFVWSDAHLRSNWARLGVIITADCDFAHNKFGGFISYLPILTLESYMNEVWAPAKLVQLQQSIVHQFSSLVRKIEEDMGHDTIPMSYTAACKWLDTSTDNEIAHALELATAKQIRRIRTLHSAYMALAHHASNDSFSRLTATHAILQETSHQESLRQRANEFRSILSKLPADSVFIANIPNLPACYNSDSGFLVQLRHVQALHVSMCVASLADAKDREEAAIRIAQLVPVSKYALMQDFASLFVRIGIPESTEEARRVVISDFCTAIVDERS